MTDRGSTPGRTLATCFGRHLADWLPVARRLRARAVPCGRAIVRGFLRRGEPPAPAAVRRGSRRCGPSSRSSRNIAFFTFREAVGGFIVRLRRAGVTRQRSCSPVGACSFHGRDAVRDRRRRHSDHRVRADHEQLVRRDRDDVRRSSSPRSSCFFPVLVNMTLRAHVGPGRVDRADALLRSRRSRRSFGGCGIPYSLPYLFTALKKSRGVLAMIGAIVGDYFGGAPGGALESRSGARSGSSPSRRRGPAIVAGERARQRVLRLGRAARAAHDELAPVGATDGLVMRGVASERGKQMQARRRWFWLGVLLARSRLRGDAAAAATTRRATRARAATPDKVTLQLKWVTQAQFAGYYAAEEQGYYSDEGLDVTISAGRAGHRPGAGRPRQSGGVRDRLARQPSRDARPGRRDRQHRTGLHAVAA